MAHQSSRRGARLGADSSLHLNPAICHFLTMREGRWTFGTLGHQTLVQSFSQHTCPVEGASSAALPAEVSFSWAGSKMYDCFIVSTELGRRPFEIASVFK